eukprot:1158076-Pelagomonas_calceolata.AAC.2
MAGGNGKFRDSLLFKATIVLGIKVRAVLPFALSNTLYYFLLPNMSQAGGTSSARKKPLLMVALVSAAVFPSPERNRKLTKRHLRSIASFV